MKKEVWVSLEKKEEKVACWLREQFFVVVVGFVVGVLYRFISFFRFTGDIVYFLP